MVLAVVLDERQVLHAIDFDALVDEARQQIVYVNGASSAECEDDE